MELLSVCRCSTVRCCFCANLIAVPQPRTDFMACFQCFQPLQNSSLDTSPFLFVSSWNSRRSVAPSLRHTTAVSASSRPGSSLTLEMRRRCAYVRPICSKAWPRSRSLTLGTWPVRAARSSTSGCTSELNWLVASIVAASVAFALRSSCARGGVH